MRPESVPCRGRTLLDPPMLVAAALVCFVGACAGEPSPAGPSGGEEIASPSDARAAGGADPAVRLTVTAEKLAPSPGLPGQVGDRLRIDVEGPGLDRLSGTATLRGASGEVRRMTVTSSFVTNGELALADDTCPPPIESELITILWDGFPRIFVHECDATTIAVFEAAQAGERHDRVFLDISVR